MNQFLTRRVFSKTDQLSASVPLAGEIVVEQNTNKIKVGDGKTTFKDLAYIDHVIEVDLAEELSLSRTGRMFIENNINLIENNDYDTLYSHIATPALAQEVTRALLKADLNPKPYLSKIPQSIRHILDEAKEVWVEDMNRLYTKSEMEAMLDEWNKKFFMQMGIPQSMIKAGN